MVSTGLDTAEQAVPAAADERDPAVAARMFKALADPIRVRLLGLVRQSPNGESCFCDLADDFNMPQSSLSHHIKALVSAGVLRRERRGTWSWYSIDHAVMDMMESLLRPGGPLRDIPGTATGTSSRCD
ncbi:metalloregulator ArsR/SmtB family transcription factor [Umezawaea endophytica]|uniref:Metalloregulator ArsR/SmtB family transcription factor n=1 Tax=Umezawaea endophytica TaxID=1654476 RepID=A0A9X3A699_9PSEU|nr:metalloregulator ArsR/SmtB family transcription factor [Umezawaea endophytica]MCS7484589.1 metalloregulator ArsR/SmtB family transcription factor [Umezawaea endophytica]